MKSISEYLEEDYIKWGSRPYIYTKKGQVFLPRTFQEVINDLKNLSKGLLLRGFNCQNLMIYSENSYEWMVLYLGIMGYVGTCVPVDKEWTAHDLQNTLSAIPISAVFYSRSKLSCVEPLWKTHPEISWFCIEDSVSELIQTGQDSHMKLQGRTDMEETAMILFTSGTTNLPKAIPLTQENLFANWETLYRRTPMTEADRSFVFLPLSHVYTGVANFLYTIVSGMQIYLCSHMDLLIPELTEVCPTVVCTVPLLLYRMYESMTDELLVTLRSLRYLYCGGSFTNPDIKQYFIREGIPLLEAYGTTETSSVIALSVPGDPNLTCNGVVFENLEIRILHPDKDGIGEILVRGKSVSKGYLNRNDHYSEFDQDGFYHTGDLGHLDESRHLYLKGRKKRMILTANGKNIYVDELEELILRHPKILAAKVFEEAHHPAISVVTDLSETEVQDYVSLVNLQLPAFKQIRKIYQKPDTPGGRIK